MAGAASPGYDTLYETLDGVVPVSHAPGSVGLAKEIRRNLNEGVVALSEIFRVETPELRAVLVADADRDSAPRKNEHSYPPGLPYFTHSTEPPTLVFPEILSPAIQPRTQMTLPLAVWHELAHAFLLRNPVVKTPAWLREFIPQTTSAAVAKHEAVSLEGLSLEGLSLEGLSLRGHLGETGKPGFTVRTFRSPATAERQMAFQNLLLSLGVAAVEDFGDGFLTRLVHELWTEEDIVVEERAEELLAGALGSGGGEWLEEREEF